MGNRWGNSGNSARLNKLQNLILSVMRNDFKVLVGSNPLTVSDFIFGGSKITADGDCSHEIKRCLLLGRKVMTNLDSILKSRDITSPTKVRLVKAMVFPVVMYGCEIWTVKKVENQGIDAFQHGVGEHS